MPDESTYGFSRGDAELIINGLGGGDVEIQEFTFSRGSSGSSGRIFLTPVGGIPAAVGTTWGSATCDEYDELGASMSSTSTIYNTRTGIIPGSVYILVLAVGTRLFVWESNCPATI